VKVEVKTEHDIDVHLDLLKPHDSDASFFESQPHEGLCQCLCIFFLDSLMMNSGVKQKKPYVLISLL